AGVHGGQALPAAAGVGQVLVVPVEHLRLVVEEVELAGPADHVQVDDVLGLGREVGLRQGRGVPGVRPGCAGFGTEERPEGGGPEQVGTTEEEVPAGEVWGGNVGRGHDGS